MANIYTITVINNSPNPQTFFFFQEPAAYSEGSTVYSNSLLSAPDLASGSRMSLAISGDYFAGVQPQLQPVELGRANVTPLAYTEIELYSSGIEPDTTTMSVAEGLTLSGSVNGEGLEEGAFRIVTPVFTPESEYSYNAGPAMNVAGNIILSSFVTASPDQSIDVQPVVKFYVSTGNYSASTVIDFAEASANAALCDATGENSTFSVTYNADGTWTVSTDQT